MIDIQYPYEGIDYPESVIELIKNVGNENRQISFDAQLLFCKALQPAFNMDVLFDKTLDLEGDGINVATIIDWDKKWARDFRIDVIRRGFDVLVNNARHKIKKYKYYKDCMLIPYRGCCFCRFGIEAHILVVE